MTSLRAAASMASLLPLLGGCLLYSHEINGEPSLTIEAPMLLLPRGKAFTIKARVADEEDPPEALTVTWAEVESDCPREEHAPPPGASNLATGLEYRLTITGFQPVCLFARVTDRSNASGPWKHKQFTGMNRAPTAVLEVNPAPDPDGTIPLYSRVVLSPDKSVDEDGDPLKYHWQVMTPMGPLADDKLGCPTGMPPQARCFVPRKDGRYTVQLVAEEMILSAAKPTASQPVMQALTVAPDRPPCLQLSDPAVFQNLVLIPSGTRRTFAGASVSDDGEPYPGPGENGQTMFIWSVSRTDGATLTSWEQFASHAPTFDVSEVLFGNPRPGDQFKVRLEVRDTLLNDQLGTGAVQPACMPREPVCNDKKARNGADCIRWSTWTVQFHP